MSERASQRLSAAAWWCVLVIAGVGPLLTTNLSGLGIGRYALTYDQHFLARAVLVVTLSFAALGLALLAVGAGRRSVRVAQPLILLAAFLGLATLSATLSPERTGSLLGQYAHYEGLVTLLAYGALVLAVMQVVTPARLRVFVRCSVVAGGLVAAHGVLQIAGLDPTNWTESTFTLTRSFASWGNPDFLGGYLVLPLAFSATLALTEESRLWRWVSGFAFGLVVLALIGTVTRGAWIAAAFALAVAVFALKRAGWRVVRAGGVASLLLPPVAFVALGGTHRVVNRVTSVAAPESDGGTGSRFDIWREALQIIGRNPLFGGGPDTFEATTARYRLTGAPLANDAHNHLLQLGVTAGVPAALALWGFFAWAMLGRREAVLSCRRDSDSALLVACWSGAAGVMVALMFGLSQTVSTAVMLVCVAVLLRVRTHETAVGSATAYGLASVALVAAFAAAFVGGVGLMADAEMMRARIAAHEGGERLSHAERAVELNPYNARYRRELTEARSAEAR